MVVGCSVALLRDGMWGLSSFAVAPERQGRGIGRALLDAALAHGPWDAAMVCSTNDPRAVRRYRLAGFDIYPAMLVWGHVQRAALPAIAGLRQGAASDVELLDEIDRASRGYPQLPPPTILKFPSSTAPCCIRVVDMPLPATQRHGVCDREPRGAHRRSLPSAAPWVHLSRFQSRCGTHLVIPGLQSVLSG